MVEKIAEPTPYRPQKGDRVQLKGQGYTFQGEVIKVIASEKIFFVKWDRLEKIHHFFFDANSIERVLENATT